MSKQLQSPAGVGDHEDLMYVKNGVVDLRNGTFSPYQQEALPPIMADVEYDAEARCPRWMKFLDDITCGDCDYQLYLQRMVGCCMAGQASSPCVFIIHGEGGSGKSVFLNMIGDIMGGYARDCMPGMLGAVRRRSSIDRPDIARLMGSRLLMVSDLRGGFRLDESEIKQLTGNEMVSVRGLHQKEFVTFRPKFKVIIATNSLPVIAGVSNGIWERMRILPFFALPSWMKKDKHLSEALYREKAGIFMWALAGAAGWYKDGLPFVGLVEAENKAYLMKTAAPVIGDKMMRNLKSNDNRLRKIVDEELVTRLSCPNDMGFAKIDCPSDGGCYSCLLRWLKQNETGG